MLNETYQPNISGKLTKFKVSFRDTDTLG